jgi:hypothetical protein
MRGNNATRPRMFLVCVCVCEDARKTTVGWVQNIGCCGEVIINDGDNLSNNLPIYLSIVIYIRLILFRPIIVCII